MYAAGESSTKKEVREERDLGFERASGRSARFLAGLPSASGGAASFPAA